MVVGTADFYFIAPWCFIDIWWRVSNSTIRLYIILMKRHRKELETILVLILVILVMYLITEISYLLPAAIVLTAIGIFFPAIAVFIHLGWMKFAEGIGWLMNRIILTAVYFIVVVPMSFLAKISGAKNGIRLKKHNKTYFIERNYTFTKESMKKPW